MTYGFCPENWPAFQRELRVREIAVGDIEKVEMRSADVPAGMIDVTVTLRSGRVDTWSQQQAELLD